MSELKITGNPAPVVGKEESYSVSQLLPSSIPTEILNGSKPNPFEFPVEWSVHVLENGKWIKKEENNKTGNKVFYKFIQKSLERKGIRILAKKGEQTARLDVKPHNAESPKIDSIEFLDKQGKKPSKPLAYGQTLKARVHCLHMERRTVYATLWEDDAPGAGHNKANEKNKMKTLPGIVKNGIADIDFVLEPDFAKIANAVKAKGDADEGKTHEYYVTAEILNKKTASTNTNVANPSYKDTTAKPATPKKETPAQKKGLSKKQEKEKSILDDVIDWWEGKVKIEPIVLPNPIDAINSVLKIFTPDKKDDKKTENGVCVCKDYDLIWGNKVSCDFRKKVVEISNRLGKDPNLLMAAMALETGRTFSPTAGKGSSYVGLIQFGDDAAESIGTSRGALLKMTALQQLDYVEKYLGKKKSKLVTLTDFYLSILMPVDVGKGSTPNHVVFDNEYTLVYKKDGVSLTDLSKSRHYGYRQNPAFFHEKGEKEKVKKGGGKKYDGEGKTYIWEIEKFLSAIYDEGKTQKAKVLLCNKEEIKKSEPEIDSGTWNVIITEKYTGKKCTHEKARDNCRRGKIEVYDHNKKLAFTISDCLLEGVAGEDRMITNSDAPYGVYGISASPFIIGSTSGSKRISYGPNPRLSFEPIKGSGDEADKSGRSAIRIHGGRQEDKTTFDPLPNPVLKRTQGCIRILDTDAKSFYDWWVDFHEKYPNIKPGKLKIIK
ncbi:hypothetical protein [Flavobacterium sp. IMCC34518]|uniref:hypothetical protein n=1 Tax=Flavobacterium sp. IMCC34518 TaxID=3003623 RepID=UPI0022AC2E57|nr:hypothetical protein [Flavobacterium sp. IMCC34518]